MIAECAKQITLESSGVKSDKATLAQTSSHHLYAVVAAAAMMLWLLLRLLRLRSLLVKEAIARVSGEVVVRVVLVVEVAMVV